MGKKGDQDRTRESAGSPARQGGLRKEKGQREDPVRGLQDGGMEAMAHIARAKLAVQQGTKIQRCTL